MPPQEKWTSEGFSATATRKYWSTLWDGVCVCVLDFQLLHLHLSVLKLADGHSHAGVGEGGREAPRDPPFPTGAGGQGFSDHSSGHRDKGHVKV